MKYINEIIKNELIKLINEYDFINFKMAGEFCLQVIAGFDMSRYEDDFDFDLSKMETYRQFLILKLNQLNNESNPLNINKLSKEDIEQIREDIIKEIKNNNELSYFIFQNLHKNLDLDEIKDLQEEIKEMLKDDSSNNDLIWKAKLYNKLIEERINSLDKIIKDTLPDFNIENNNIEITQEI